MKKISLAKTLTLIGTAALMMGTMAGCGNAAAEQNLAEPTVAEIENEDVALADTFTSAPYFTKGVYVNYLDGAEDIKGYWAMLQPSSEGSGYYEQAIARDYMDGYLLFDVIGHNCGDDEIDIPVSDSLSMIIDSITFNS